MGVFWGVLGGCQAESSKDPLGVPVWALSWSRLGGVLGRLGGLLCRLGALWGRFGALLEASRAILGRYWGTLGPSWSVGKPTKRQCPNSSKTDRRSTIFRSRGLLGSALGDVLGASCAVLQPSWASWNDIWASRGLLGPPWGPLGAVLARLGAFWTPEQPREKPRQRPGAPRSAQERPGAPKSARAGVGPGP